MLDFYGALRHFLTKLYWCILNRLTPHPEKSEAVLICKTRATGPVAPIHIGNDAIVWVNKSRLLFITVDDKLSWVPHILRKEARPNWEVEVFTKGCSY